MNVQLFERLIEERKRLKLTQDQMAETGGVAKRTYCNYEAGLRAPDAEYLSAIAAAGADVLYILTGVRGNAAVELQQAGYSAEVLSKDEQALLDNYRHCPPEGRACIKATSDAFAQSAVKKKAG